MHNVKPLQSVSYDSTSGKILQYAATDASIDVSQDDVTGDCTIYYQNTHGRRLIVCAYDQAMNFASLVMSHYPMQPFNCAVDY